MTCTRCHRPCTRAVCGRCRAKRAKELPLYDLCYRAEHDHDLARLRADALKRQMVRIRADMRSEA